MLLYKVSKGGVSTEISNKKRPHEIQALLIFPDFMGQEIS
jgi:hypothetical protein